MSRRLVTVTGASGFVGQILRPRLRARGYEIDVFDRMRGPVVDGLRRTWVGRERSAVPLARARQARAAQTRAERTLVRARVLRPTGDDILDLRSRLAERFRGRAAVVHLAALAHPHVEGASDDDYRRIKLTPPKWFHRFAHAYATGPQGEAGDVTESRGHLWGAGLTVRRAAWDHLSRHGFAPLLPDRRGVASFNSGGDTEICLALRMAGWRLRYEPRLRLEHLIVAHRLDWGYLRGLSRGVGASSVGFDPYRRALGGIGSEPTRGAWLAEARRAAGGLARGGVRPRREPCEGEALALHLEWKRGRLTELLRQRGTYDRRLRAVSRATWRRRPA